MNLLDQRRASYDPPLEDDAQKVYDHIRRNGPEQLAQLVVIFNILDVKDLGRCSSMRILDVADLLVSTGRAELYSRKSSGDDPLAQWLRFPRAHIPSLSEVFSFFKR